MSHSNDNTYLVTSKNILMSKLTIVSNSHSLSDFQQCEQRHLLGNLISLEPLVSKKSFDEGSFIHLWLKVFYSHRMKPKESKKRVLINAILWQSVGAKRFNISGPRSWELYRVLVAYSKEYKTENWKCKGVEVGFSKVIYEDDKYLFIYEGKVDWIGSALQEQLVVDHKSRNGKYQMYEFNNQCRGYLWATGATKFVYNYLTLTNIPSFSRETFQFTFDQIEAWKSDTIEWYFRMARALEEKKYLKSWNCTSKYGVCEFHSICEATKIEQQMFIIRSTFKQTQVHRSW